MIHSHISNSNYLSPKSIIFNFDGFTITTMDKNGLMRHVSDETRTVAGVTFAQRASSGNEIESSPEEGGTSGQARPPTQAPRQARMLVTASYGPSNAESSVTGGEGALEPKSPQRLQHTRKSILNGAKHNDTINIKKTIYAIAVLFLARCR